MKEKYKYLGKNTILFALSSFGTKILSFLLVPVYTSVLTTEQYGSADLITTTGTLLIFILTINISSSVLRFTLEQHNKRSEILSYAFRVLLIGTLVCSCLLGIIANLHILDWPIYYYLFILLYFFANAFYEMMSNYLRAIDKVSNVALAGVLSSCVTIFGNIFFLLFVKAGLIGYLLSIVLSPLCASVYCVFIAREPITTYFHVKCEKKLRKEMVSYCVPLIFNNISLWINAFLDRYFITCYCGVAENGIYSVAGKIPTILSTCYGVFASAWTLSAIKEFDPEDKDGFFSNTYNTYAALMTIVCSFIVLMNKYLANFLYSKEFFAAWKYSAILLISVMFNTLTVFQGSIFSAAKKNKVVAYTTMISALFNTIFNIILIPRFGTIGAAIATAIAYFVMWLTRYIFLKQIIAININFVSEIFAYLIIVMQIIFEHLGTSYFCGKLVCFFIIILLKQRYLKNILEVFVRKIRYGGNN